MLDQERGSVMKTDHYLRHDSRYRNWETNHKGLKSILLRLDLIVVIEDCTITKTESDGKMRSKLEEEKAQSKIFDCIS